MRYCFVPHCKETDDKITDASFHFIPKNEPGRQLWITAIGHSKEPGKFAVVCSKHFKHTDYDLTSKRIRLKPGAVPSVFEYRLKKEESEEETEVTGQDSNDSRTSVSALSQPIGSDGIDVLSVQRISPPINIIPQLPSAIEKLQRALHDVPTEPPISLPSYRSCRNCGASRSSTSDVENVPSQLSSNRIGVDSESKNKFIRQPKHLPQVRFEHLCSPRLREKYWLKAMDEIRTLKKKVRALQVQKRRLARRVNDFKSLMQELLDEGLLSDSSGETIDVS